MTCENPTAASSPVFRRDIVVASTIIVVLPAISTLLTPLFGLYQQKIGFTGVTLTLIYAVYVIGNLVALLMFGGLSDAVGRRPIALGSFALAAVSAVVFLFADNVWQLGAGRIVSGLGVGIGSGAAAAWLVELLAPQEHGVAATLLTAANFVGLGAGALLSGALADAAPAPLKTPFIVYLAILALMAALVAGTPETVTRRPFHLTWPRLGVPADLRAAFIAPAIAGFGALALVGFYACLAPGILAQSLHLHSHLGAGLLLAELAAVGAATIVLTRHVASRTAMLIALALMPPAIAMVVAAQFAGSLAVMVTATALCAIASGLGYRGSLQVVNEIAPADKRAELASALFVCCFIGNALPVIGVAVLAALFGPVAATAALAALISLFAVTALWFGQRRPA